MINLMQYTEIFSILSDLAFEYNISEGSAAILYKSPQFSHFPNDIPDVIGFIDSCPRIFPAYKIICEGIFCEMRMGAPMNIQEIQAGTADSPRWYRILMSRIRDSQPGAERAFGILIDITAEKTWHYMSERDSLTGLYNRTAAQGKIHGILSDYSTPDMIHAFLMTDLDHFKTINDTYGHAQGDYVLTQVAAALTGTIRLTDIAARIGGDEFIIFLRNIGSREIAGRKAREICQAVSRISSAGHPQVTISIGIAMYPRDGSSFEKLYTRADQALYVSKKTGRNTYSFCE